MIWRLMRMVGPCRVKAHVLHTPMVNFPEKHSFFLQITGLHSWHLNDCLFPAEKLWVYGWRTTRGMCLLPGSQLEMIITLFFIKRKCYRQLNVFSGWFKDSWKKVLSLCFSFPFSDLGLLYHQKARGPWHFLSERKPWKIYIVCSIEEAGEKTVLGILRIRKYYSSATPLQCLCIAKGTESLCAVYHIFSLSSLLERSVSAELQCQLR